MPRVMPITSALAIATLTVASAALAQDTTRSNGSPWQTVGRDTNTATSQPQKGTTPRTTTATATGTVVADSGSIRQTVDEQMLEIRLGQLAQSRAADTAVKNFGQRMVTDHSSMNQQWTTLARNNRISTGTDLNQGGRATVARLEGLSGATFDRAYMQRMIQEKATQPNPGATNRTPLLDVFIQGKIGMIEGLPPIVGQINEKNPDLDWEIAPSPTKDGQPVTLGVADYFVGFNKDEDKQGAIAKFLDFFYEQANYVKFNDNEGFIPATKSGAEAAAAKPELKTFLEALPDAKFYPATNPAWGQTSGAFKSDVGQIETKSPDEVLKAIQAKADAEG